MTCRICENSENNLEHEAHEQMLGLGDSFRYLECDACGCLQLLDPPVDMSRYYPDHYYSFKAVQARKYNFNSRIKLERLKHVLQDGNSILSAFAHFIYPPKKPIFRWLKEVGAKLNWKILDLGCGSGETLVKLAQEGFDSGRLLGVDPYLKSDIQHGNGVRIVKKELAQIEERYNLIMSHHAFEHMADPGAQLSAAAEKLVDGGVILLRIPLAGSDAWREYGVNWVQLDAPRHLFLHTPRSIAILAGQAGLRVEKTIFDSTEFQFLGSEAYLKNIPLKDIETRKGEIADSPQIESWQKKAAQLNTDGKGDQAGFIFRKK